MLTSHGLEGGLALGMGIMRLSVMGHFWGGAQLWAVRGNTPQKLLEMSSSVPKGDLAGVLQHPLQQVIIKSSLSSEYSSLLFQTLQLQKLHKKVKVIFRRIIFTNNVTLVFVQTTFPTLASTFASQVCLSIFWWASENSMQPIVLTGQK